MRACPVLDTGVKSSVTFTSSDSRLISPALGRTSPGRISAWPTSSRRQTRGFKDHIGAFVVTAGIGSDEYAGALEAAHDDYGAIMTKALADRLAEAFAERMHERVRKEFWGYSQDEDLGNDELIKEQYQGVRPAPGYPACPDHTEKSTLWKLLDAERNTGVRLTENFAMWPAASVSGLYFSHPRLSLLRCRSHWTRSGRRTTLSRKSISNRRSRAMAKTESWHTTLTEAQKPLRCDVSGSSHAVQGWRLRSR